MATKWVFIYCRISADVQGRAEGVEAQEKWGREYAADRWPGLPIRVFADNDISAAKEDVVRPAFERLREGVLAGECAHLWAVEQSRLTRIESVWFGLVADLLKAGVDELHTKRDGIRRLDDVVGGIMAVLDAAEVRKLKKRINDKLGELAAQGRPGGGFCYGYRNSTDAEGRKIREIVPEQAEVIRWAAERILSGWSLSGIVRELNERGERGYRGGKFEITATKRLLTAPTIAGLRVHQGKVVGKATWEPILDEQTWRMVCSALRTRTTVKRSDNGESWHSPRTSPARRRWMLTGGLVVCGTCRAPMWAFTVERESGNLGCYYRCMKFKAGCGRMSIQAVSLENHVAAELFDHLAEPEFLGALSSDDNAERRAELVDELASLDARRLELSAMWPREITTDQFREMNDGLNAEQQQFELELADLPVPVAKVDPVKARAAWPWMNLDERRKLVSDWVDTVIIHKAAERPTTQMIADRVGMSRSAVHLALAGGKSNHTGHVSEDSRQRILAAAADLGYVKHAQSFDPNRVEIMWIER